LSVRELTGWFLDVFPDPQHKAILWIFGDDGRRHYLGHRMAVTFYAAGPEQRLRQAAHTIAERFPGGVHTALTNRTDLFAGELQVLAVLVTDPTRLSTVFHRAQRLFPDLDYYDADVPFSLRYTAATSLRPLARCRVRFEDNTILDIDPIEDRQPLENDTPPFRLLQLAPDTDPEYLDPAEVILQFGGEERRINLADPPAFLSRFEKVLQEFDPDILLSKWGDTWLLPLMMDWAEQYRHAFNPNRGPAGQVVRRKAFSYHTYGQVLHRGQQVHLQGRWHIDQTNAIMYGEYQLAGVFEQARITGLPVQEVARKSPGAGITAMQMTTAMRAGVMVPYHKSQVESFKTPAELVAADRGGLVGQPITGIHYQVASIDFYSMYPQIMSRFNVSPETLRTDIPAGAVLVPGTGAAIDQMMTGFVGRTLQGLLERRLKLKRLKGGTNLFDNRSYDLEARISALKWLLVVCFGYLGHKHFRWMKIEAHEAVTALGREMILQAKQIAEEHGFRVLYFNVDGLYIQKQGALEEQDFTAVLREIQARTGLLISLDGIYRWISFLPSRTNAEVPVANRYFGMLKGGKLKVRGIEMRRHDTPPFVFKAQAAVLQLLSQAAEGYPLEQVVPVAVRLAARWASDLRAGRIPLEDLVVTQRLSRDPTQYRVPSPAARAAAQLASVDKPLSAGQVVHFLYIKSAPGVLAWRVGLPFSYHEINIAEYLKLLARAVSNVLSPLGSDEKYIANVIAVDGQMTFDSVQIEHMPLNEAVDRPVEQVYLQSEQVDYWDQNM
jgi:DNA polymerase-2